MSSSPAQQPSPQLFFQTINAYQRSEALKAAIELEVFTAVQRAGENVSASEVEETLKQHPAVFDAAVVAIPDPVRDQSIKAYVIVKEGAAATADQLIAWCRERLSPFKVPEVVDFRDAFPRTSVGKIQKHLF